MELNIEKLQAQLEQAVKNSQPVIISKVSDTPDETVYVNETSGTKRVDLKGGQPVKYEERAVPKPEVHFFDKPFDEVVGKVILRDDSKRVIDLTSGTKRTDHK